MADAATATRYILDEAVSMRAEGFGGLAYHYGTRQLLLLESPLLVTLLGLLDGRRSLQEAMEAAAAPDTTHGALQEAVQRLERSGIVHAE